MIIETILFAIFCILFVSLIIFITIKTRRAIHRVLIISGLLGIILFVLLQIIPQSQTEVGKIIPNSTSVPLDYEIAIQRQVEKLRLGQIVFTIPEEMKLGESESIRVRISDDLQKDLKAGLKGNLETNKIDVSSLLQVKLSGTNFNIQSQTEEQQILKKDGLAEWIWSVTPQEKGKQALILNVYASLQLPNNTEKKMGLKTFERTIKVSVSPNYWVENNWKWIVENWEAVTLIFTLVSGFVVAKWKQIITLIKNWLKKPVT